MSAPRVIAAVLALGCSGMLSAQQPGPGALPADALCSVNATAGSPTETALLAASLLSSDRISSVLRPLMRADADSLAQLIRQLTHTAASRCDAPWRRPWLQLWYNSATSRHARDGGVWQGKGFTLSISGGVAARFGPFEAAVRPLAYVAENGRFEPSPAPLARDDYRDPLYGTAIDLPYRFGDDMIARLDPGESYVRVAWRRVRLGITTESQQWGPAHHHSLLIGTEGAGYPRLALEGRRMPLGIGAISAQWHLGWLESSTYAQLAPGDRSRLVSAFMASFAPSFLPGLEIGGSRFFHVRRGPGALSWSTATLPFSGILKTQSGDAAVGGFNQLGAAFFRVAPGAGVELYGEIVRDDHNADMRDLIGEPDHASAYVLGVRRVVGSAGRRLHWLTLEHVNSRFSHLHRTRPQALVYTHASIAEGHSFRGQPIASSAVLGGGGTVLSWTSVETSGSRELTYERRGRAQNVEGGTWNGEMDGMHLLRYGAATSATRTLSGFAIELGWSDARRGGTLALMASLAPRL